MSFQNPWLLLGLIAAAIPVAIHLINRQRAPVVRFAALEHLLMSDKRLAQRLKLRQLLVLALRVGLIAALALALAKPSLTETSTVPIARSGPGAVALIIDDSLSMNASMTDTSDTLLDLAIDEAEAIIAQAGAQTSFALVASGSPARLLTPAATFDRQAITRALAALAPGARGADTSGALREAERVLAETGQTNRQVIIIGDHAAHAWREVTKPWALDDPPSVERIDLRQGSPIANLAITGVEVRPALELGADKVHVTVSVANHGPDPATTTVTVSLGTGTAKAAVDLPGRGAGEIAVTLTRQDAEIPIGLVSLPADALLDDNQWPFGLGDGEAIRVGLVNGAPHDVAALDEVFFLRAALDTVGPGAPIRTTMLDVARLDPARLGHLDVVILANPGALSPPSLAALRGFVRRGGGLFITAGDRLTSEAAQILDDLMPIPLRGHKQVADPRVPDAALAALHITDFDLEHPVTALFASVDDVSLLKAKTYRVALLDPTGRRATVLASFTGGLPALVEGLHGDGRTMLWTTTIDRDWSDLALRTSFVPLVHQLMAHLARRDDGRDGANVTIGASVKVPLPAGRGGLVLHRPDGAEVMLEAPDGEAVDGVRSMTVSDIDVLGRYTLRRRSGGQERVSFTAHPDPLESDLIPASTESLDALLQREGDADQAPIQDTPRMTSETARHPLWPYLLLGLFGLLLSEAWLVLRQ
ncbi:MAG: BatA domain-containing protein [Myxococcota bacterium]